MGPKSRDATLTQRLDHILTTKGEGVAATAARAMLGGPSDTQARQWIAGRRWRYWLPRIGGALVGLATVVGAVVGVLSLIR